MATAGRASWFSAGCSSLCQGRARGHATVLRRPPTCSSPPLFPFNRPCSIARRKKAASCSSRALFPFSKEEESSRSMMSRSSPPTEARRFYHQSAADEPEPPEEVLSAGCARAPPPVPPPYDVFINHRGVDTRHTVARLLHDRLVQVSGGRVRTFLDSVSLRPGDRLVERLNEGMRQCKVAVAIFSERYLDSEFCLHELAALVEARKVIVPIFYGVKPSALDVLPPAVVAAHAPRDVERFRVALREAKYTVGLAYDPATGDLAELVSAAANAVMQRIEQIESMR